MSLGQKRNRGAYGIIRIEDRIYSAHRVSWEMHNGPIRAKMNVLHHCDNAQCVRPSHLWLGTTDDNNKDKAKKGRAWKPEGEKAPWAKLTEKNVLEIRSLFDSGKFTQAQLARKYGVVGATIGLIVRRINWTHIK